MAQSFNAAFYGDPGHFGSLSTHWRARGVEPCARDLPLKPTRNAVSKRVSARHADGQSLAGTGALVWEGEALSGRR